MSDMEQTLSLQQHCVLSAMGSQGPIAGASPFWWDGASLWVPGSPATAVLAALRADPRAAVYVPPCEPGAPGVLLRGRARVYGWHDPVAATLHWPALAAAASALAVKHASLLVDYARDLPRLPAAAGAAGLVLGRITSEWARAAVIPEPEGPMGPALPSVVPPSVRRSLSGVREAAVATAADGPLLVPAGLSAGLRLSATEPLADGPAAAVLAAGGSGLALEGRVDGQRLVPERARWWTGLVTESAEVGQRLGDIELPD